ncbi:MAG: hypothetical protein ACI80V_003093 [Rhodothermales bacterium]|jgi:hypothetical protein
MLGTRGIGTRFSLLVLLVLVGVTSAQAGTSGSDSTLRSTPSADFLTKEFSGPGVPGGQVTLTFTILNNSGGHATNLTFTDDLGATLSGLAATGQPASDICGTGSVLSGTDLITLSGGSLRSGDTCTFDITLRIPSAAEVGAHTNTTGAPSADIEDAGDGRGGGGHQTFPPATADLVLVAGILLEKEFTDDPVPAGADVTMRFTLSNTDPTGSAEAIAFSDGITAFMGEAVVRTVPASGFCGAGATIAVTTEEDQVSLDVAGASLTGGGSCTFDVILGIIAGAPAGSYTNTTSDISALVGGIGVTNLGARDDLVIQAGPLFSKSFSAAAKPGDVVDLVFTLSHLEGVQDVTDLTFSDDLEATLTGLVATGLPMSNVCGPGSVLGGTSSLTFSGGSVAAGGSCTFSVPVRVPGDAASGSYTNTTSPLLASIGTTVVTVAPASTDLQVVGLVLTKEFTDDPASPGGTATLMFSVENAGAQDASGIAFTDDLEAVLTGLVSTSGTQSGICGAGSTVGGTTTVGFSGGSLVAGTSCSFSIVLQVPADATLGNYLNITSVVSANPAAAITFPGASDVLEVTTPISLAKRFTGDPVLPGGVVTLEYTIANAHTTLAATGLTFTDDLEASLAGLAATGLPKTDVCGAGSLITGTGFLSLSGGVVDPGSSCTFSLVLQTPGSAALGSTHTSTSSSLEGIVGEMASGDPASDDLVIASSGVAVDESPEIPEEYWLGQNYPNPFNPVTSIPYALPVSGQVRVEVFDVMGRSVAALVSGIREAGYHTALWDASGAPSGVYLYRIQAEGFVASRRLVLLK